MVLKREINCNNSIEYFLLTQTKTIWRKINCFWLIIGNTWNGSLLDVSSVNIYIKCKAGLENYFSDLQLNYNNLLLTIIWCDINVKIMWYNSNNSLISVDYEYLTAGTFYNIVFILTFSEMKLATIIWYSYISKW